MGKLNGKNTCKSLMHNADMLCAYTLHKRAHMKGGTENHLSMIIKTEMDFWCLVVNFLCLVIINTGLQKIIYVT